MKKLTFIALALVAWCLRSFATEAISSYQFDSENIAGSLPFGGGFEFSPISDINVTALGYQGSLAAQPYQITIWTLGGTSLASATVTGESPTNNQSQYTPIPSLQLFAGQTYFVNAAGVNDGQWNGFALIESPNTNANGSFTVGNGLEYLTAAWATNAIVPGNPLELDTADNTALLVGANFEFEIVGAPEPSLVCLTACAVMVIVLGRRRMRSQSEQYQMALARSNRKRRTPYPR
jgi:hypothetical protein